MIDVIDVTADVEIPERELDEIRDKLASLDRYTDEPILGVRLTLRAGPRPLEEPLRGGRQRALCAQGEDGRVLAAHVAGPNPQRRPRPRSSACAGSCAGSWAPRWPAATSRT